MINVVNVASGRVFVCSDETLNSLISELLRDPLITREDIDVERVSEIEIIPGYRTY